MEDIESSKEKEQKKFIFNSIKKIYSDFYKNNNRRKKMENIISQANEISVIKNMIETKEEKSLYGNKGKNEEENEICEKNPNDDFKEKKKLSNNINIQKKYISKFLIKYGIKSNKIFIAYFYDIILKIILLSLFIKCNQRKIELAYSYINL